MSELIVFFSRRDENYVNGEIKNLEIGNTEVAAGMIQELTGAYMFKIEPLQAYSKKYNECIAQAQEDQRRDARPELRLYPESIQQYQIVILLFPNFWSSMPMAVFTFLEHYDFTGKIIKPLCTHEGSGMGSSIEDIKRICPGAIVEPGLAIRGGDVKRAKEKIKKWLYAGKE